MVKERQLPNKQMGAQERDSQATINTFQLTDEEAACETVANKVQEDGADLFSIDTSDSYEFGKRLRRTLNEHL